MSICTQKLIIIMRNYVFILSLLLLQTGVMAARINAALSANGGVASASSFYSSHEPSKAIDGQVYDYGGGWLSAVPVQPQWLQVDFNGIYIIDSIVCEFSGSGEANQTYLLEYWDGDSWQLIESVAPSLDETVVFTFSPVSTSRIRYYVTVGKPNGYALMTELKAFGTFSMATSIAQIKNSSFQVYPNPSNHYINIGDNINKLIFYNVQGVIVKELEVSESLIDVNTLKSGLYMILATDINGGIKHSSFIKK